jgi:hypothetical protein
MTASDVGGWTKLLFLSTFISQSLKPHSALLSLSVYVLYTVNRLRTANNEGGTYTVGSDMTELWQLQRWARSVSVSRASTLPNPVYARSKEWVLGRSVAGIAGSNPTAGMQFCLLRVLCVIRLRSLRQADHSSRGDPPCVCASDCDSVVSKMR